MGTALDERQKWNLSDLSDEEQSEIRGLSLGLHTHAKDNNGQMIQYILDFSPYIDIDIADYKGNRPLHIGAQYGSFDAVKTLV